MRYATSKPRRGQPSVVRWIREDRDNDSDLRWMDSNFLPIHAVYVGVDPYEGFREFVLARGPALSRAAYLLTGNRSSAEELVQAALVKAAVRWRRVAEAGDPEAYVRRIIVNEHISSWRRFGRRELADPDPPGQPLADPSDHTDRRLDLAAALAQLPKRQRAVIVLRYYHDMSEVDTAEAMRCSVGTVKSQAHAALAKLRSLLPDLHPMGVPDESAR